MKKYELDFDKWVEFGSDGVSTMVGKQNGVAARLRDKVNFSLNSVHCMADMTSLPSIAAMKLNLTRRV